MSKANPKFIEEFSSAGVFNATACLNCGTCTGLCPMGRDIQPRLLFRYVVLGLEDKVTAQRESLFSCLLCRMCEANCPAGVKISDNIRALRAYFNRKIHHISRM